MVLLYNKNTLLDRLPNLERIALRVGTRSDSVGKITTVRLSVCSHGR